MLHHRATYTGWGAAGSRRGADLTKRALAGIQTAPGQDAFASAVAPQVSALELEVLRAIGGRGAKAELPADGLDPLLGRLADWSRVRQTL